MSGRSKSIPVSEFKADFLKCIAAGDTVADALSRVGRGRATYDRWRRDDAVFAGRVDSLRQARSGSDQGRVEVGFPEFSEKFLGMRVWPHMQNVVDLLDGREPSWLPSGVVFEPGEPDLIITNMPPEHGKSVSLTINYVTYRVALNPNIRIIIVSKTQAMARKFLYAVKQRLTHPRFAEMHANYAPGGGFESSDASWTQDLIYVSSEGRDSGEKDPTIQSLGIRGHIYGARADLIILDDCVDLTNAHEYEKQIDWLQAEVMSRLSAEGRLLVVGTRLAGKDLYHELREDSRYPDDVSPWTYLSMPAVLEFKDDVEDWVTLWPRTDVADAGVKDAVADEDGLFPKWDGPRLAKKRARIAPRTWAMVYMQQQVTEDAIFHPNAVRAAINGNRLAGLMPRGMVNTRAEGMDGLIVLAGLDPAMAGHTAAVVIGLEPGTQRRFLLDVSNKQGMTPDGIRGLMKDWTTKYGITEWRVEKNAFQSMLTQDREVREFLAGNGAVLREHHTGTNKHDVDFGVASMTTLFQGWEDKNQLLSLPSTHSSEGTKALVEQLVTWHPAAPKTQKTDCVMALWFTELACRDRVQAWSSYGRSHVVNPFATRWDKANRNTVDLMDLDSNMMYANMGG
jgi:hypothetical protein